MKNATKIISCYAADTSGVCSALYELGGMVVVHDASGCNSTYSTHDEPRWYDKRSKIYISALTENDAIMGNDEKLISDIVSAANDQHPAFIAVCGSPMPMMTGVDFDAIADEIERRSNIRTFAIHTNGTHNYLKGASDSLLAVVKEYAEECQKTENGVNILGATPLDVPLNGTLESIKKWLKENGFDTVCSLSMDCTLDDIRKMTSANVNLVVSYSGLAAAEYLYEEFGIPFVCGVPVGREFSKILAEKLKTHEVSYPCADREKVGDRGTVLTVPYGTAEPSPLPRIYIIGEGIFAGSLARAWELETGEKANVICPLDNTPEMLAKTDITAYAEEDIEAILKNAKTVIADPLYKFIAPKDAKFISLPHFAFSGRCYARFMPDLINGQVFDKLTN